MSDEQKKKMIKVGTITPEIEKICRSKKSGRIKKSDHVIKKSPFVGYDVYRVVVNGEKKYRIGKTKYTMGRKEYAALKELGAIEPASQAGLNNDNAETSPAKLDRATLPSIEAPKDTVAYTDDIERTERKGDSKIHIEDLENSTFFDDYKPVFDMGIDKKASLFGRISEFFGGISESTDRFGYNVKERAIRNLEKERPSIKSGHKHYMK